MIPVGHASSTAPELTSSLNLSICKLSDPVTALISLSGEVNCEGQLDTAFSRRTRVLFRPKFKLFFAIL
jgi:hypothetical protein